MLITEDFTFSFQIGDGDIVLIKDDSVSALVEPEKFLGTETHSLSKLDAWRKAVASVQRREQSGEYMYLLSTDGFRKQLHFRYGISEDLRWDIET